MSSIDLCERSHRAATRSVLLLLAIVLGPLAPVAHAETFRIDLHVAASARSTGSAIRDYGAVVDELVLRVDDALRRLAYSVQCAPGRFHAASLESVVDGDGCRLLWTADALTTDRARRLRGMMEEGARAMKATLEANAAEKEGSR